MKKLYTLLICLMCSIGIVYAQPVNDRVLSIDNDTTTTTQVRITDTELPQTSEGNTAATTDGGVQDSTKAIMDELKKIRQLIEKDNEAQVIATLKPKSTIRINENPFPHRAKRKLVTSIVDKNKAQDTTIDSIYIVAQGGFIVDIIIYAGGEQFFNTVLIGITKRRHFNNRDILYNQDGSKFVYYQDAVMFQAYKSYVADDARFTLSKNTKAPNTSDVHRFVKGTDLKSALDLRVYTDALGVFADNPNGLVQVDASTRFLLHQSNITNRSAFILHNIKTNVNFARYDSKQQYVAENEYSRSALLQRSWFNAGLSINLFEGYVKQHYATLYFIDGGGSIHTSSLAKNTGDTINVTSTNIWGAAGISVKGNDNYGFTASASVMFHYSPQTADIDFARNQPHVFFKPCFEAFYNPFGDETNRVFTKISYWMDTWNLPTQQNHFWQFQIGYNTTLSKLSNK